MIKTDAERWGMSMETMQGLLSKEQAEVYAKVIEYYRLDYEYVYDTKVVEYQPGFYEVIVWLKGKPNHTFKPAIRTERQFYGVLWQFNYASSRVKE